MEHQVVQSKASAWKLTMARIMLDDCGILVVQVDKLHRATIETAEAGEGRNAQLQHEFDEKF